MSANFWGAIFRQFFPLIDSFFFLVVQGISLSPPLCGLTPNKNTLYCVCVCVFPNVIKGGGEWIDTDGINFI